MSGIKMSKIYCAKCESDKISLDQMKCLNCGSSFTDEDIQDLLTEAYEDHLREQEGLNVVEILAGGLDKAIEELDVKAIKTFDGEKYQVWELAKSELKKLDIDESKWKDEWGFWRTAEGSNMSGNPIRRYTINNKHIKAYDGDRRLINEEVNKTLPVDERWDIDNRKYGHLLEYISEEIGASQPGNICAICVDLAKINGIKMSALFEKYNKNIMAKQGSGMS